MITESQNSVKSLTAVCDVVVYRCLLRSLGEAGEIEPETDGMLTEYGIDTSEFAEEVFHVIISVAVVIKWHHTELLMFLRDNIA